MLSPRIDREIRATASYQVECLPRPPHWTLRRRPREPTSPRRPALGEALGPGEETRILVAGCLLALDPGQIHRLQRIAVPSRRHLAQLLHGDAAHLRGCMAVRPAARQHNRACFPPGLRTAMKDSLPVIERDGIVRQVVRPDDFAQMRSEVLRLLTRAALLLQQLG